jgi:DNA-binding beta-propeller fold protein YncE
MKKLKETYMLLLALMLMAACSNSEPDEPKEDVIGSGKGVIILCEGNYQAGNSTLSYYNPEAKTVQNGVFFKANDAKMGDTGQSIQLHDGLAYVAMENSGIIWALDTATFKVKGQLTAGQTEHMINPRYIHFLSSEKAYVTDLYSPYITIFNPRTMQYIGSIHTGQPDAYGYNSTEEMVQYGNRVFTNCWSYSNKVLVIDITKDEVCDSIMLSSWQPKSMALDARGKLWVITDGGYETDEDSFSDNIPHLYRVDAASLTIEQDQALDTDNANVQLTTNPAGTILYIINNDVYRMEVTAPHVPVRPFIEAEIGTNGRKHFLYGIGVNPHNGEIYVADAVDYSQSGVVYRYNESGTLLDKFRVGITPNGFAFK